MATKTTEQRINDLKEKINKLDNQKNELQSILRVKERKERTRRLIQIGAIIDSMGINNIEVAERFKDYFINNPKSKQWLDNFIAGGRSNESQEWHFVVKYLHLIKGF